MIGSAIKARSEVEQFLPGIRGMAFTGNNAQLARTLSVIHRLRIRMIIFQCRASDIGEIEASLPKFSWTVEQPRV